MLGKSAEEGNGIQKWAAKRKTRFAHNFKTVTRLDDLAWFANLFPYFSVVYWMTRRGDHIGSATESRGQSFRAWVVYENLGWFESKIGFCSPLCSPRPLIEKEEGFCHWVLFADMQQWLDEKFHAYLFPRLCNAEFRLFSSCNAHRTLLLPLHWKTTNYFTILNTVFYFWIVTKFKVP